MIRTVREATVHRFHDETLAGFAAHRHALMTADNLAKHLKALRWRTPYQAMCDAWRQDRGPVIINPHHLTTGLNT